jgi:hypothetical protein
MKHSVSKGIEVITVTREPLGTCNFMTSPHAGAPTNPVPTFLDVLSRDPTFLGFS